MRQDLFYLIDNFFLIITIYFKMKYLKITQLKKKSAVKLYQ